MNEKTFGANLKAIRNALDMSQAELAKRSGLTPSAICQIERGEREPTLKTILAILKVIPVKFEKLAGIEKAGES